MSKYVLRELPGIVDLEARLHRIDAHPNPEWAPDMDGLWEHVDRVTARLFGLTSKDVLNADFASEEEEAKVIEALEERGWDLTDGKGEHLACVTYILFIMAWAVDGKAGHLPDAAGSREISDGEARDIEARLRDEAAKFRPGKPGTGER